MRKTLYLGIINMLFQTSIGHYWLILPIAYVWLKLYTICLTFKFWRKYWRKTVFHEDSGIYIPVLAYNDNSHLETNQVKRLHEKNTTLRIWDVYPGSRIRFFSIPDLGSELFNAKKWFLSSRKYDTGCSSQIPDPDPDFLLIPDTGSRGHRIPAATLEKYIMKF